MKKSSEEGKVFSPNDLTSRNILNSIQRTALMAAAASGQKEVLKLLIANNAAIDLKTPIDWDCADPCYDLLAYGVT